MSTYYEILEVPPTASSREITSAYRQLMQKCHPDKHRGDSSFVRRAQDLNEAYGVLKDPVRRREYDNSLALHRSYEAPRHSSAAPGSKEDLLGRAVVDGKRVTISYVNLSGIRTRRTIRPDALFRGRLQELYLRAYCELRGEQRTFRVSRISEISMED